MPQNNPSEVIRNLVLTIFRINGALLENADKRVSPFDLTSAQSQVLSAIGLNEQAMTAPQIAKFIGISRQAVQKQLNILIKNKLIIKQLNPYHERSPLYSFSEQGALKHQAICQIYEQSCCQLADGMTLPELATTLKMLQFFYEHLLLEGELLEQQGM